MSDGFDQNRLLGPADDVSILAVTLHRRRDRPDNTCQAALIAATAKKVAFPVCRSFDPAPSSQRAGCRGWPFGFSG